MNMQSKKRRNINQLYFTKQLNDKNFQEMCIQDEAQFQEPAQNTFKLFFVRVERDDYLICESMQKIN
ncbi:hypothetical protein pb186bvf_008415 [Paramecium bursaria]